jgi:hypothetical protein
MKFSKEEYPINNKDMVHLMISTTSFIEDRESGHKLRIRSYLFAYS